MARQWVIPGGGAIDEDGEKEYVLPGVGAIAEDQAVAVGDIDTAEKRRSVSGIWIPLIPGVTPNAGKDQEWRQEAGWSYNAIAAETPAAAGRVMSSLAASGGLVGSGGLAGKGGGLAG